MTVSVKKLGMALPCIILVVLIEVMKFSMETVVWERYISVSVNSRRQKSHVKCKPTILAHGFGSFLLVGNKGGPLN